MGALMSLQKVSYTYPGNQHPDLEDISLEVQEGQFVLVAGLSGSGKSTLLRIMAGLIPRFYGGDLQGEIELLGKRLAEWSHRELSSRVGLLFQDPESQLVTTRVDQELLFGMENIGYDRPLMHARLQEVTGALTMQPWLKQPTLHLSGGWKQKTLLASIIMVRPRLLLLDEPLSQLDAASVDQLLDYLEQCRRLWGISIVVAEHRLDKLSQRADTIWYLHQGSMQTRSWAEISSLTYPGAWQAATPSVGGSNGGRVAGLAKVEFQYPHSNQPVLKECSLDLQAGEITCLMGANGAGKTTLLKLLIGTIKPLQGQVDVLGEDPSRLSAASLARKIGYLSQEPGDYLYSPTVREEIQFTCRSLKLDDHSRTNELLEQLHLQPLAQRNPRDLSWGERQRVALASILVAQPPVLLLDEPTRGLDNKLKAELGYILRQLANQGTSILVATHDENLANSWADRIMYLHDGILLEKESSQYPGEEWIGHG
jgi:energy-coupling factor transport system ATP-binding protein